jgi:uncharacterized protein YeaO (DUF488 family)
MSPRASGRDRDPTGPSRPHDHDLGLGRVYDHPDGRYRVLVDRLWPRGVTKVDAALDEWLEAVAPSTELRRWYSHDVSRFDEFSARYLAELGQAPASTAVEHLADLAATREVLLLTATRDVEHSGAHVLRAHLLDRRRSRS